ncbi:hypothetical protein GCM10027566_25000 [Arachidicoccus ginsenosidivorans]|uniref:Rhodanese-like domain-containing protein n=1 Tax=Arachidicoccus ginsenosidivorans TaxID=496057 RepID=A0A5B8VRF4_9BACT|nr:rhodanese-like domain-containing protein [Arachidicoccus ginsenosidivorans]QEC73296.1 rhodanese-like domain-containing protein [Arachidicoccus ginsenosidivorans]
MKINALLSVILIVTAAFSLQASAQDKTQPWNANQLLAPEVLAKNIGISDTAAPLIICIGPSALIKGSVEIGPAQEHDNLVKLRQLLSKQPKDREMVIYCGCCPFDKCPNIRPAFAVLKEMEFTDPKLLNLPHNLKVDWIDKGFPINEN